MVFRRRRPRWGLIVLAICAAIVGWRIWAVATLAPPDPMLNEGVYRVESVNSDLTIALENGARVRLLGIAPILTGQQGRVAKEAHRFLVSALTDKSVRIQFDRERVDPSGVFMAYVFFRAGQSEETLLNEHVLANGWGQIDLRVYFNESHKRQFRKAELDARQKKIGRWANAGEAKGSVQ